MVEPVKKKGKKGNNVVELNPPSKADEEIIVAAEKLLEAEANKKKMMDEENTAVKNAKASFKEVVERGHDGSPASVNSKLDDVEASWQDWQETLAGRTEMLKECNETVKKAISSLRELIENRKQMKLDFDEQKAQ